MVYIRVKIIIKPNVQKLVLSKRLKTFSTGGNVDNGLSSIRYILSILFEIQMYLDGLNIYIRKAVLSHCQMNENTMYIFKS